jgi:hypothetical protein
VGIVRTVIFRVGIVGVKLDCVRGRAIAQASRRGGPGSSPGQLMWDLWWTKWHWGRFSPST